MMIRERQPRDDVMLYDILNEIVEHGGITAIEPPFTIDEFRSYFLGDTLISLGVAEDEQGEIIGFQSLNTHKDLPPHTGDIASYVRLGQTRGGVGAKLFDWTKINANSLDAIYAVIRSDNVYGLGYYSKMGFQDAPPHSEMTLKNGKVIKRVHKIYSLS